jgi:hypothetical protein
LISGWEQNPGQSTRTQAAKEKSWTATTSISPPFPRLILNREEAWLSRLSITSKSVGQAKLQSVPARTTATAIDSGGQQNLECNFLLCSCYLPSLYCANRPPLRSRSTGIGVKQ